MSISKTIKPDAYYDVRLAKRVAAANAVMSPRDKHRLKGKVLSEIIAQDPDAVAEAAEV